ncbi:MAG: hypothetical protein QY328_14115 [Anaerolineales bacterium]|nr:MAG: hypothetical protein QY328_14115 [Anaerolineales bacterium]
MEKSYNTAFVIFGYTIIEVVALLTSLVASFFTWAMVLYRPNGTSPGDGFGFLIILMIGVPIWITTAILSPIGAHILFKESIGRIKRIAFSFLTPVITAVITSAIITLWLEWS